MNMQPLISEMAYAALLSLKGTIERLINSSQISIVPHCPEINDVYEDVRSLLEFLKRSYSSKSSNGGRRRQWVAITNLDKEIREATCKLEDALESHSSNQFLSQSESLGDESNPLEFHLDLQKVKSDINYFTETTNKIKDEYNTDYVEDIVVSSRINFGARNSKMVGLSDEITKLKDRLLSDESSLEFLSIVGMVGIGKSTLVKQVYEDPEILKHFSRCVWVTVGPEYEFREVLFSLVAQLWDPDHIDELRHRRDDELHLRFCLFQKLYMNRYLIVLDDVWDDRILDDLRFDFPDDKKGSRIVLTTRLENVGRHIFKLHSNRMRFMNNVESWYMFCDKVFAKDSCPRELEKVGRKILRNCEGLPLAIIVVGNHLFKADKTLEYWNKVADKKIPIFDCADELEAIFSSYKYLPLHLKACFLYLGVFPRDSEIPASKVIKMWCAEGFHEPNSPKTLEDHSMQCLQNLISSCIVLVRKRSSNGKTKTCGIHYVFQHLCITEASKDKFYHILNGNDNSFTEGIENQRRMCTHTNVLFGIKDVRNSLASVSTTTRSLLCTGPYHEYPVPMYFGLSLLKVLDALTIRFYKFPVEVIKLVQLKYLAYTCNGKLPSSVSKLWNLEYLIVHQHLSIKTCGAPSYLPSEIWNMRELRHLEVTGSDLPDPPSGALLPNLLTLLDVSAYSCTKEVFEGIPKLKKLGIQIELAPDNDEPPCCFDHLVYLHELESLKCVIVNPRSQTVSYPAHFPVFPSTLKKLTLSGFGYSWEFMNIIADLLNLEVLKLRCHAFQGPEWETCGTFWKLRFLLIEDTDLEYLIADDSNFPSLERLLIRDCYKLKHISPDFGYVGGIEMIELVDCNPLGVASAKEMLKKPVYGANVQVCFRSSWEDGKHES